MNEVKPPKLPKTAVTRIVRARLADQQKLKVPDLVVEFVQDEMAERFVEVANAHSAGYFDPEGQWLEREFLAKMGSELFERPIAACLGCSKLMIIVKEDREWCSIPCARQFQQFCREERAREQREGSESWRGHIVREETSKVNA